MLTFFKNLFYCLLILGLICLAVYYLPWQGNSKISKFIPHKAVKTTEQKQLELVDVSVDKRTPEEVKRDNKSSVSTVTAKVEDQSNSTKKEPLKSKSDIQAMKDKFMKMISGSTQQPVEKPPGDKQAKETIAQPKVGVTHVVAQKENLWRIAQKYNTTVDAIMQKNNLKDLKISVGQILYIPSNGKGKLVAKQVVKQPNVNVTESDAKGIYHYLKTGENLFRLSKIYKVSVEDIVKANNLQSSDKVQLGQKIYIPKKKEITSGNLNRDIQISRSLGYNNIRLPKISWPLKGTVTSKFGFRWGRPHKGIDIIAPYGSIIKAAAPGVVVYADNYSSFGKLVAIDHHYFYTLYAHNAEILVREGEFVQQGQPVSRLGSSGRTTGPNLHFEFRLATGGQPIDPLKVLRTIDK